MDWKKFNRWWRVGVVILFFLGAIQGYLKEQFFHTDRILADFLNIYIFFYIPDLFRRAVDKRRGNIFFGVCCFMLFAGIGIATLMHGKYETEEIVMPIYGEYMVTSGKREKVLISTRKWNSPHWGFHVGKDRLTPEYIYIVKKGIGSEEYVLHLLRRRYGAEVTIRYGNIIEKGDQLLGAYYLYERDNFDLVKLKDFDERPFPAN